VTFLEWTEPLTDPLVLVTAAIESDSGAILVDAAHLPDAFFDLKTGVAGEFAQKAANYRLRVAAVLPHGASHGDRFDEFAREAKNHPNFRTFTDRAAAETWLSES
jgi:hypothetical protein